MDLEELQIEPQGKSGRKDRGAQIGRKESCEKDKVKAEKGCDEEREAGRELRERKVTEVSGRWAGSG